MTHITIDDLSPALARCVEQARRGEPVVITSGGEPVARIVSVAPGAHPAIQRLIDSGEITWNGRHPQFEAPVTLPSSQDHDARPMSDLVIEDRG